MSDKSRPIIDIVQEYNNKYKSDTSLRGDVRLAGFFWIECAIEIRTQFIKFFNDHEKDFNTIPESEMIEVKTLGYLLYLDYIGEVKKNMTAVAGIFDNLYYGFKKYKKNTQQFTYSYYIFWAVLLILAKNGIHSKSKKNVTAWNTLIDLTNYIRNHQIDGKNQGLFKFLWLIEEEGRNTYKNEGDTGVSYKGLKSLYIKDDYYTRLYVMVLLLESDCFSYGSDARRKFATLHDLYLNGMVVDYKSEKLFKRYIVLLKENNFDELIMRLTHIIPNARKYLKNLGTGNKDYFVYADIYNAVNKQDTDAQLSMEEHNELIKSIEDYNFANPEIEKLCNWVLKLSMLSIRRNMCDNEPSYEEFLETYSGLIDELDFDEIKKYEHTYIYECYVSHFYYILTNFWDVSEFIGKTDILFNLEEIKKVIDEDKTEMVKTFLELAGMDVLGEGIQDKVNIYMSSPLRLLISIDYFIEKCDFLNNGDSKALFIETLQNYNIRFIILRENKNTLDMSTDNEIDRIIKLRTNEISYNYNRTIYVDKETVENGFNIINWSNWKTKYYGRISNVDESGNIWVNLLQEENSEEKQNVSEKNNAHDTINFVDKWLGSCIKNKYVYDPFKIIKFDGKLIPLYLTDKDDSSVGTLILYRLCDYINDEFFEKLKKLKDTLKDDEYQLGRLRDYFDKPIFKTGITDEQSEKIRLILFS